MAGSSQQSSLSRLERVFTLLENGASSVTRKAAAKQLGEVQKKHPHELNNLLVKLLAYICHNEWATRIAAAEAIEAVVSQVPSWNPVPAAHQETKNTNIESRLTFSQFDVDKVLSGSLLLLGSSGDEYQMPIDTEGLNAQDRAKKQRKLLEKRLGLSLGSSSSLGVSSDDLFQDEDLIDQSAHVRAKKKSAKATKQVAPDIICQISENMSSRERNRAKRRAKLLMKQQSREGLKQDGKNNDTPPSKKRKKNSNANTLQDNVMLYDDVPKHAPSPQEWKEWPFNWVCDELTNLLFNSSWESRHGACLGLQKIMKKHGESCGKVLGMDKQQLLDSNESWLTDLSIRLLCVISLDRFADYVSDQVVAPVRESCAQTLSVVVSFIKEQHVFEIINILLHLYTKEEWEVRQSAVLALQYIIAVRKDLQSSILSLCFPCIIQGLSDNDDDVKSICAKALIPTTELLTQDTNYQLQLKNLLSLLWGSLRVYDDLTSSTQSILLLLSKLIRALSLQQICDNTSPETLVSYLWPFLHHAAASVREAALSTLITIIDDHSHQKLEWLSTACTTGLWNVLQCCLLESVHNIRGLARKAFLLIVEKSPTSSLIACTCHVPSWMNLACQPTLVPYSSEMLIDSNALKRTEGAENDQQKVIGGRLPHALSHEEYENHTMKTREFIARMIGFLCGHSFRDSVEVSSQSKYLNLIKQHVLSLLKSLSALQRMVAAILILSWWEAVDHLPLDVSNDFHCAINSSQSESFYFTEITTKFLQVQTDTKALLNALADKRCGSDNFQAKQVYSFDDVIEICTVHFPKVVSTSNKDLHHQRDLLLKLTEESESYQSALECRVKSYIAGVVVNAACSSGNMNSVWSLPDKLNPVIRPLMESVKKEENLTARNTVSTILSRLIGLCATRTPCPNAKLIKNLCSFLCSSPIRCPTADSVKEEFSAETLKGFSLTCENVWFDGVLTQLRKHKDSLAEINKKKKGNTEKPHSCMVTQTSSACDGAVKCLQTICEMYQTNLFVVIPYLWEVFVILLQDNITCNNTSDVSEDCVAEILQSLVTLEVIVPVISESMLQQKILTLLPRVISLLWVKQAGVRFSSARCITSFANHMTNQVMPVVLDKVVCNLDVSKSIYERKGAIEAVTNIINLMGSSVVTYAVLLVVPLLGCMSDFDMQVRLLSTYCFAQLIQFMPVESSIPDPPNTPQSLIARKNKERRFLEQLFDSQSLEAYQVPVPIKATLRSYQEDGVKWLAFLNRYKLHGVLCDEMGLGKTLQTICIIASDHYYKKKQHMEESSAEIFHLTSLVICPPTLTGHWVEEIRKFCDVLHPLQYAGTPQERTRLQKEMKNHNLVVASYEVVRNDISFFNKFKWNYCVLDEGHAIRNGKSKTSQCIKTLNSNHRLILTGTPIQNSVLELWSLFDFLIPGFLGSEQEFNMRYTKPIVASREAKSSSKEQEEGVLAMDALHRQVLPFMLRRMKEDVLKDLPPKIIQDYYCDLSPLQLELYEDFARSRAKKTAESSIHHIDDEKDQKSRSKGTSHVFQALQYLQKVCNHPLFVLTGNHPRYQQIMTRLKSRCSSLHDVKHAAKLVALRQLLLDCGIGATSDSVEEENVVNQHRALIFCQHRNLLDIIQKDLFASLMPSVTFLRLDGSIPASQRFSIVSRFNNDPSIDVLLLTTKVGGLGLNLTGADTVIFVEHDWNPMVDLQAMDRAHRIGQKRVVNVYRLITRGTLEEKILGLQKFKLNVANSVVGEDNRGLQSMGTSQVLDLFTVDKESKEKQRSKSESSKGLRAMMEDLGELWDQNQYADEYNLDNFIQSLDK